MHSPSRAHGLAAAYGAALVAGLVIVGFPASATLLKTDLRLDDAEYGAIFLPQVALAIAGSLAGAALVRRVGLGRLLALALASFALSQLVLAGTTIAGELGYSCLLLATALGGLGFGLAAAPFNTYPGEIFPARREAALVALHTLVGAGFAIGPVLVGALRDAGAWVIFPLALAALAVLAGLLALWLPRPKVDREPAPSPKPVAGIAGFLAIAILYAFAEGTFANWASVFLHEERGVSEQDANLALAFFWGSLSIGRLAVSALLVRVPARAVWLALPLLMLVAFAAIPYAEDALAGLLLFGLAGLACSAFFPLTVGLAVETDRSRAAAIASAMTAALMLGVGVGSFVLGPLREFFSLAQLYWISASYPVLVLVIAVLGRRPAARPLASV